MQSKPQILARSVALKSICRIGPYLLVLFLCLFSHSGIQSGFSESDLAQTRQAPAISGTVAKLQSPFDDVTTDNRFKLLAYDTTMLEQSIGSADGVWKNVKENEIATGGQRAAGPKAYRTLTLSRVKLNAILASAPLEFGNNDAGPVLLTLPSADGTFQTFRVVESPIMEPALAARFPEIKTYSGQGVEDPTATTRFDWTPQGFHAIVLSQKGTVLIEPYDADTTENYIAYFQRDVPVTSFGCDVSEAEQENAIAESKRILSSRGLRPDVTSDSNLRTYRLAIAATAEYTQRYGGGTVPGAFSAMSTTMNVVNAIYQTELGIKLVFVANEWDPLESTCRHASLSIL